MRIGIALGAAVTVVCCACSSVLAMGPAGPTWNPRETILASGVNVAGMFGCDRTLEYDHWGNPGVALDQVMSPGWVGARYLHRSYVGWQGSQYSATMQDGSFPSLAYDRYERPSISYKKGSTFGLIFEHNSGVGPSWDSYGTVFAEANTGRYSSLAYDAYGKAAIVYGASDGGSARFAYDTNGDFVFDANTDVTSEYLWSVFGGFAPGTVPTLAFDTSNRPVVAAMTSGSNATVQVWMRDSVVGWGGATLEAEARNGGLSMAINPKTGFPAVVFQRGDGNLVYREYDGHVWQQTVLTSASLGFWYSQGFEPSLAFDPGDGNPAVAFVDNSRNLWFAWSDGSSWHDQMVDASRYFADPSLAFNQYGTGWPGIFVVDNSGGAYFFEDPQGVPEPGCAAVLLAATAAALRKKRSPVSR